MTSSGFGLHDGLVEHDFFLADWGPLYLLLLFNDLGGGRHLTRVAGFTTFFVGGLGHSLEFLGLLRLRHHDYIKLLFSCIS